MQPQRPVERRAANMAGKEGEYYKGDKKEGGFLRFLYNPDTKEVFGRTGLSWFKITVFYIIFYACLTAFWTIMLIVFYQTLDTIRPTWVLEGSAIGTIPAMRVLTLLSSSTTCSILYFWAGTAGTWKYWVEDLQEFLKDYDRQEADGEHLRTCSFEQPIDPNENKACRFALESIASNCSSAQQFGYEYGQPCVLLKLNRNVADIESMGPLAYFPSNRIENYYFPYKNTPGYLSPFVFVQFLRPERGVLINMECKAWAKNIKHDRQDRIGSAHFELMVD
ncbi:hypothetical protein HPB50_016946 [Hyalomma asiaticum]|uniref:Uncharacterized protein n=1 Tax=Hyalomma asiaticum TaxID=266040 RepID=A0ACB7SXG3_HYAAI|nr:hypothetical protein HPB50_016946 [Hyalomma asiaticum]